VHSDPSRYSGLPLAVGAFFVAIVAALSGPVRAATTTTPLVVTATVISTCVVVASPLAFGNYDPTSATATAGTTTVIVTCTAAVPYNVGLDAGTGTGATVTTREMTGTNSALLDYGLFQDAGHSTVWGNTIGINTLHDTATGLPITYTVYGLIPPQQSVGAGLYTDDVTVTITY
jgi:spore coat protein U-like protein